MKFSHLLAAAGLALTTAFSAQAALVTYSTDAAFTSAAGGSLNFEDFEGTPSSPTIFSLTFGDVTFSCSVNTFCPTFFGQWTGISQDGSKSVFFASPDTATFTFSSAITAFGVYIGGAGDVGQITLSALLSNGDSATALSNYTGGSDRFTGNSVYFGVISDTPFTSITFTPSNFGDGIFFDSLRYGTAAVSSELPEPGSLALLGLGLAGLAIARRRKQA